MTTKSYSPAHTKWMCKYHIVFTPKYSRKEIYNQLRRDLIEILKRFCKYKGVEIYRKPYNDRSCPHADTDFTQNCSILVYGIYKGEKSLMVFEKHAQLKYKYGNRKFWAEGYDVSTVVLNKATIRKYIREQEAHNQAVDKLSVKEYEDLFSNNRI